MADEQTEAVHLTISELRDLLSMVSVSITDSQLGRPSLTQENIWGKLREAEERLDPPLAQQRSANREIERVAEESVLCPRRWDGRLQQWAKDILKRDEPKQDEAPREEQVQKRTRGLRM